MITEEPSLLTRIRRRVARAMNPETFFGHIAAWWVFMTVFMGGPAHMKGDIFGKKYFPCLCL